MNFVIDASALLAVILNESGQDEVTRHLPDAEMSSVNLSEVYVKLIDQGTPPEDVRIAVSRFQLNIRDFSETHAEHAANFRPLTRHLGLSFGDRACLAHAQLSGSPVLTADREWARLDIGVDIRLIR